MYTQKNKIFNISDVPIHDRPREKIKSKGIGALTDAELIAVFLNSGTQKINVLKLAELVSHVVDTSDRDRLFENLVKIHGIGEARALSICAVIEFVRRKIFPASRKINTPVDIFSWLRPYCEKKQEHFIVFTINGANEILSRRVVTVGLLNSSQVHPREVFADAIADRAAAVVLAHNHPSGNNEPSIEDLNVTKKLKSAGEILGVSVLDHIIFSENGYTSFLERKLL
ncbi:MAG: DNA repair protein RadC [Spirochaetia bacterium]|nr:DNA repair protein RadC [Spirochaetia bacterium]